MFSWMPRFSSMSSTKNIKDYTPPPKISLETYDPDREMIQVVNEVKVEEIRSLQDAIAEVFRASLLVRRL